MKKPIIGITSRILYDLDEKSSQFEKNYVVSDYIDAVLLAGGVPLILPIVTDEAIINAQVEGIDALLVAGGIDVNPLVYGEEPIGRQNLILEDVDNFDITVVKIAHSLNKPIFGICRGLQIINAAFGGTLYQDIPLQKKASLCHDQNSKRSFASHSIKLKEKTKLYNILGADCMVNSYHHQAIKELSPDFINVAEAKDGIIEAIEKSDGSHIFAVQWHPESMVKTNQKMLNLFKYFIEISSK